MYVFFMELAVPFQHSASIFVQISTLTTIELFTNVTFIKMCWCSELWDKLLNFNLNHNARYIN